MCPPPQAVSVTEQALSLTWQRWEAPRQREPRLETQLRWPVLAPHGFSFQEGPEALLPTPPAPSLSRAGLDQAPGPACPSPGMQPCGGYFLGVWGPLVAWPHTLGTSGAERRAEDRAYLLVQ